MGPIEGDGSQSEVRERIHAAAVDELARWGIDRFSIEALADRHGLDPNEIRRYWPDREALILPEWQVRALEQIGDLVPRPKVPAH